MTNHAENETTDQLPPQSHEARITTLEASLAAQQNSLNEINGKLDMLIKMQQDMYVDLRGRFVAMDNTMVTMNNAIHQIQRDIQPDSFQNRLMSMGR